jgi:hypothetical protein
MLIAWLNAERYSQEIQLHKKSNEVRNKHFENVGLATDSMKSPVGKTKQNSRTENNASVHKPNTSSPLRVCKMHNGSASTVDKITKSVTSYPSKCVKAPASTTVHPKRSVNISVQYQNILQPQTLKLIFVVNFCYYSHKGTNAWIRDEACFKIGKKSTAIPAKALRFQEVEANDDGEVISPRHRPPLPP